MGEAARHRMKTASIYALMRILKHLYGYLPRKFSNQGAYPLNKYTVQYQLLIAMLFATQHQRSIPT